MTKSISKAVSAGKISGAEPDGKISASAGAGKIARVYIQLKTRALDRPFDYVIPERFADGLGPGSLVLIPFGRQKALGLVGEIVSAPEAHPGRLAEIEQVLDDYPAVPEPLVRLALWISEYFYCSPAAALGLVLPPGGLPALSSSTVDGKRIYFLKEPRVKPRTAQFVRLAAPDAEASDGAALGEEASDGVASGGEALSYGSEAERKAKEEDLAASDGAESYRAAAEWKVKEEKPGFRLTAARKRILVLLEEQGELPLPEAARLARVGRDTIRSLAGLGALKIVTREVHRDSLRYYGGGAAENDNQSPGTGGDAAANVDLYLATGSDNVPLAGSFSFVADGHPGFAEKCDGRALERNRLILTEAQQQAVAAIKQRLEAADPAERSRPILIQGVAGAGKTEVYLRAIEAAMARGEGAIVLVPEISLTHQAVKRFRRRFGGAVGVLHSGLSLGERYDEYRRVSRGEASVVIGPRSALFAPVHNLSLIILDEENDSSFKQESEPRYDARRVALQRARLEGAAPVYGSATPSLESYHLIKDRIVIPERATGAAMPSVEIVDMLDEKDYLFSARLLEELDRNLSQGGKSILLLNSRGYARFLQCGACGHLWKCKNCEVSLTIHQRPGRLLCHHCGFAGAMPDICPECRSSELRRWGVGTQQLERQTRKLFPEASVFRLDADSASGYGEGPRIIEAFEKSDRGVLVGTQMVAKGHHFPDVTLSAVINADLALAFPEFRAEEMTFSLLTQLAGRSGRAERPGKVLLQTWNRDIECIRMAADQALEEFYRSELVRRERLGFPPFARLINVLCLSRESDKSGAAAAWLKEKLVPALRDEKLLGPAELLKLKGWHRSHILIKTGKVEETLAAMKPAIERLREPYRARGVRIIVDVDPQWLS